MKLHELKAKAWYRLVKVFYAIFFIIVVVIIPFAVIENSSNEWSLSESYIVCNNGKRLNFAENDIWLNSYSPTVDSYHENKVRFLCQSDDFIALAVRTMYPNIYNSLTNEQIASRVTERLNNPLSDLYSKYMLDENYTLDIRRDYNRIFYIISMGILGILIAYFVFELGRRIFYYITLGRFFPKE